MKDIREEIFTKNKADKVTAGIYADMDGIISGVDCCLQKAKDMGLTINFSLAEGDEVYAGDLIIEISGTPMQIVAAEDGLVGELSKYSGVATAARAFVRHASGRARIVCGSWKKMPGQIKAQLRTAIVTGGAEVRICNEPMLYLDKNYVAILGGIQKALMAVANISGRVKIIQVKGSYERGDIGREALTALYSGADIIYVDTGRVEDLRLVRGRIDSALSELGDNRKLGLAFGGGVKLKDVEEITQAGADIIGVGRAIIDAPLLDMHLNVNSVESVQYSHNQYQLFNKHELTIDGIMLNDTNLNQLSDIVADVIGVAREDVLVIDVRDGQVCLDVLQSYLDPEKFVSREETLLNRLRALKGVELAANAKVVSNGMLGWITGDDDSLIESQLQMARSKAMAEEIRRNIAKRVIVFPTGAEVEAGEIEDTNTPLIMRKFSEAGFNVEKGEVLKDDLNLFSGKLRKVAEMAYGVCITTGGVGAENKDFSVEAILKMDPNACTPYIAKFRAGHGRHSKDGIRIGVGQEGVTTYIALPGPNDEVSLCIDTVIEGISQSWSKEALAISIAKLLRERLKEKLVHRPC